MLLSKLHIQGFRNFRDATIVFSQKSLVIGSNDIGKSNLLYALRILFDRSISENDLELRESDFFAYAESNRIQITAYICEISEGCILSKMREHVSDDGCLVIRYIAERNAQAKKVTYQFWIGESEFELTPSESRIYLRVLNLRYMGSRRDLATYIRQERKNLLQEARTRRSESEIAQDSEALRAIEESVMRP